MTGVAVAPSGLLREHKRRPPAERSLAERRQREQPINKISRQGKVGAQRQSSGAAACSGDRGRAQQCLHPPVGRPRGLGPSVRKRAVVAGMGGGREKGMQGSGAAASATASTPSESTVEVLHAGPWRSWEKVDKRGQAFRLIRRRCLQRGKRPRRRASASACAAPPGAGRRSAAAAPAHPGCTAAGTPCLTRTLQ